MAQQFQATPDGDPVLTDATSPDAAELEQLVRTEQVFVVRRTTAGVVELGSQVRTSGMRFVSVDEDGVENDELMKLGQFHE
ncbi:hypothetical protein [Rhizobacter sp. LjRoot28]|uniref:hypothetical protein n=1 Tax=Rhizobacter sp. LjRoot28 TaxID=3342309 RepID=UPI003ECD4549